MTRTIRLARSLLAAAGLDFVPCSDLFAAAFDRFAGQQYTRLSFADAAIAYVAQERAEGLLLTFDQEFSRIAGIRIPAVGRL